MRRPLPVHPLLFGAFPILFLLGRNMHLFSVGEAFLPIAVVTACTAVVWAVVSLLCRDVKKAALIVSLGLILFFSYSHFRGALRRFQFTIGSLACGPREIVCISCFLIFCSVSFFVFRTRRSLAHATRAVNVVATCLVAMSLLQIGAGWYKGRGLGSPGEISGNPSSSRPAPHPAGPLPDIYYIILDGYARADVLAELYDYDNGELLTYLRDKGFYVADKSRSNYCQTSLSLASSLNMDHVPNLTRGLELVSYYRSPLGNLIKKNKVMELLKQQGYKTFCFQTGYYFTEIKHADVYVPSGSLSLFQNSIIDLTPTHLFARVLIPGNIFHEKRILCPFEHLPDARDVEGPVFAFAHIVFPHPPFVFDQNGGSLPTRFFGMSDGDHLIKPGGYTKEEYIRDYRNQLAFANRKLKETIDRLLSDPSYAPVIILQADHGPGSGLHWEDPDLTDFRERFSILNAYYFPDKSYESLYSGITPVNTFRVVFNRFLGGTYDLVEDESYFSTWYKPYEYIRYENPE